MKIFTVLFLIIVLLGFIVSDAESSAILTFGDYSTSRNVLAANLGSLGHTVTNTAILPGDLSPFDSIWHVGAFAPLSAGERTQLAGFLGAGGGVHLTGERPCCEALNDSLEALVNSVVAGGGITVGDQGDIGGPYSFNPNAAGGITGNPNSLVNWNPNAPGGMAGLGGLGAPSNVLVTGIGGIPVGGVWDSGDLVGNSGRLTLLMDVNWISNSGSLPMIENIETYLEGATAVPEPGTTTLLGIGALAMAGYGRRRRRNKAQ